MADRSLRGRAADPRRAPPLRLPNPLCSSFLARPNPLYSFLVLRRRGCAGGVPRPGSRGAARRQGGARALAHAEQHAGGPSRSEQRRHAADLESGRSAQVASMAAGGASGLPPFWWSTSGPVAVLARFPSSAPLLPPPLGGGAPRGHGPCVALRGGGRSGGEGQAAPEQGREDGGSWRRGGQRRSACFLVVFRTYLGSIADGMDSIFPRERRERLSDTYCKSLFLDMETTTSNIREHKIICTSTSSCSL